VRFAGISEISDRIRQDDPADAVPEPSLGPPVSKSGDLWLLGRHRVLCGNTLDLADFAALMGEERAAMVFTDPPYNVPIDGHASGLGAIRHRPFPMASGEMDQGSVHRLSRSGMPEPRRLQRRRIDPLHLHGLAPLVLCSTRLCAPMRTHRVWN
jgi:hypothetical protein